MNVQPAEFRGRRLRSSFLTLWLLKSKAKHEEERSRLETELSNEMLASKSAADRIANVGELLEKLDQENEESIEIRMRLRDALSTLINRIVLFPAGMPTKNLTGKDHSIFSRWRWEPENDEEEELFDMLQNDERINKACRRFKIYFEDGGSNTLYPEREHPAARVREPRKSSSASKKRSCSASRGKRERNRRTGSNQANRNRRVLTPSEILKILDLKEKQLPNLLQEAHEIHKIGEKLLPFSRGDSKSADGGKTSNDNHCPSESRKSDVG